MSQFEKLVLKSFIIVLSLLSTIIAHQIGSQASMMLALGKAMRHELAEGMGIAENEPLFPEG